MQTLINLRWATDDLSNQTGPSEVQDPVEVLSTQDKELRELITQDVERTMQENHFFTLPIVKKTLEDLLYLWAKDNVEFGYRQGMNEVLGILVYAFFQEIVRSSSGATAKKEVMVHNKCNEDVE